MTHLYLIRHADYIYEKEDGKGNKRDLGLSIEGLEQAETLRERLAKSGELKPDIFISSPERGAHETAKIVASVLDQPILLDEAVMEWRSEDGSLSTEEFMARWQQLSDSERPYYRFVEGCETRMEFTLRIHLALNRILQQYQNKNIVIMTHGAVIQTSFMYFFGYGEASQLRASVNVKNTSITHWLKTEGQSRWILERSNDYHHLTGALY